MRTSTLRSRHHSSRLFIHHLEPRLLLTSVPVSRFFDESWYLAHNPDVALALASDRFSSGLEHFSAFGNREGRNPSRYFDTAFYLQTNPDVASAVAAHSLTSAYSHFLDYGNAESRNPTGWFNGQFYMVENSDVQFAHYYTSTKLFDHYFDYGNSENRTTSWLFDPAYYLSQNPDVATAVSAHQFTSALDHFLDFGARELRNPTPLINLTDYQTLNPDVAAQVSAGTLPSLYNHFANFGNAEFRTPNAAFDSAYYASLYPTFRNSLTYGKLVSFAGPPLPTVRPVSPFDSYALQGYALQRLPSATPLEITQTLGLANPSAGPLGGSTESLVSLADNGVYAGNSGSVAFIDTPAGRNIYFLGTTYDSTHVLDVNSQGVGVGTVVFAGQSNTTAAIFNPDGSITIPDFSAAIGATASSSAIAINENNQITGAVASAPTQFRTFRYDSSNIVRLLDFADTSGSMTPADILDNGIIAGTAHLGSPTGTNSFLFYTTSETACIVVNSDPFFASYDSILVTSASYTSDISNIEGGRQADFVGNLRSTADGTTRAFIYSLYKTTTGLMGMTIGNLVHDSLPNFPNADLLSAASNNKAGILTGRAHIPANTNLAYLFTPTIVLHPSSSSSSTSTMFSITSLIHNLPATPGLHITSVLAQNNRGQLLVAALDSTSTGTTLLLSPRIPALAT